MFLQLLRYRYRLGRALKAVLGRGRRVEMSSFLDFYRELWQEAAEDLGADWEELAPGWWEVRHRDRATLIRNFMVQLDDPVILELAGDRGLCHRLLQDHPLPVPEHLVYRLDELPRTRALLETSTAGGFVVKPAAGTSGAAGITLHVRTPAECRRASVLASLYCRDLLLERWVAGESYRLLVLDGRLLHATRRRGLRVTGDGRSTVRQLLARESGGLRLPPNDPDMQGTLAAQNLTEDVVLESGREVLVRSSPLRAGAWVEARTVFDEEVTDQLGPDLRRTAEVAARVLRSRFAGVDVITLNPALPLEETGGVINEVNTTPGLHHHYHLRNPGKVGPAIAVLRRLLGLPSSHEEPGAVGSPRQAGTFA